MATISKDEVKKISKLANITLRDEKSTVFSEQLSSVLTFVETLSSVETNTPDSLENIIGLKNIFREDEIKPCLTQEEALSNAPLKHNGYFKVKAIF